MIRKWLLTIFMLVIFYVLQTTLFKHLMLANVVPNLLIILTVSNGYIRGNKDGMFTGLLCGLFSDCIFGSLLGVHALIYMLVGFISGYANNTYSKNDFIMPLIYIGIGDLLYGMLYYLFEFLLRGRLDFTYYFKGVILPEALYTMLAAVLFYKLITVLNRLVVRESCEEAL